ncbi:MULTISPECIES: thioredoxin family protein [Mammaliicoccus]|uniref:thioredoxin family protein n=1 Tax=Mammaliicoccus TaxID=2803850 RepID=UPI000993D23D|nr:MULTISPECIES: thioredoxin family protein [Mammaliicoccus]MBO3063220.1 thioredoxin family protein [Mammaliicoccus fleurettii]MBW0763778.1 thioredoxin family protein [Mammaliicoccus fleurettii]MEB6201829.1 thioredoxin family protein [Mammaliicoccus fleurettii]MEB7723851.1 thioredoxin family protein [Mammaliicoccus fleurettii]MEB7778953.1 thioredoxin family protein [Mammaliicoccus fleurettii]
MRTISQYAEFEEITQSEEPVVVKFFADWCPDCTRMNQWIDPIIDEYHNFNWYQINRDQVPEAATENDVMGIPSLLVFKNNEKLAHLHSANAKTPEDVKAFLAENLK